MKYNNREYRIMYRVIAPYNKEFIPIWFETREEANNYIKKNSISIIPFDHRFLMTERRVKFNTSECV